MIRECFRGPGVHIDKRSISPTKSLCQPRQGGHTRAGIVAVLLIGEPRPHVVMSPMSGVRLKPLVAIVAGGKICNYTGYLAYVDSTRN